MKLNVVLASRRGLSLELLHGAKRVRCVESRGDAVQCCTLRAI